MKMDEIDSLVAEYNAAEQQQAKRLERLYDLLDARAGYRKVEFGAGYNWSNCWGWAGGRHDLAIKTHITPMIWLITKVEPGVEKS